MAIRLDTVQAMDQGSAAPIGTLTEVREIGLRPMKYGSCSMPGKNNIGCKHYNSEQHGPCPVLELCRARKRKGYENVAFVRILSPTVMKQDAMLCHQYMDTLAHADPRNGINHIIGLGGDTIIKRRVSVPVDPKDPKSLMKVMLKPERVPAALRPNESMAERVSTMELARDLQAKGMKQDMALMDVAGRARGITPPEDTVEEQDEVLTAEDEALAAEDALDDDFDSPQNLEGDGDPVDDDDESVLDDDAPEPEAVRQVSRGKRGRGQRDG